MPSRSESAAIERLATARAPRSATARTRPRQPSSVGAWGWARATIMLAPSSIASDSSGAPSISSRRSARGRARPAGSPPAAVSETRSGARTRSTSEAIIVSSSRRIGALGSLLARMCSVPTTLSATRRARSRRRRPGTAASAPRRASGPRPPASRPRRRSRPGSRRARARPRARPPAGPRRTRPPR